MDSVATPLAFTADVPNAAAPSLNVTLPTGIPPDDETVAVNVIEANSGAGLSDETTAVAVAICVMVCVWAAEVLPVKSASPE